MSAPAMAETAPELVTPSGLPRLSFTVREWMAMTGKPYCTVLEQIHDGTLAAEKRGRSYYIPVREARRLLT